MTGLRVKLYLLAATMAAFAGCAVNPSYTDATISPERKAYIHCAVVKAYSRYDAPAAALDIARNAVQECEPQKRAVYAKLLAENAGQAQGKLFADSYISELSATMVSHIALRLDEVRTQRRSGSKTPSRKSGITNI
jgi:hypothetical protein